MHSYFTSGLENLGKTGDLLEDFYSQLKTVLKKKSEEILSCMKNSWQSLDSLKSNCGKTAKPQLRVKDSEKIKSLNLEQINLQLQFVDFYTSIHTTR